MNLLEYLGRAAGAWFLGFFPLAEIYVAVPAAMAAGLDYGSVVFWTVFGNFTPILVVHFGYSRLSRIERVNTWFTKLTSPKLRTRVDRYGTWFVLAFTPWVGVWVMGVTAKALGMNSQRLFAAAFVSILIYAVALVAIINAGTAALTAYALSLILN